MTPTRLIAVFAENKPGQTANITQALTAAGVNICWVTVANNGHFGVMKFLVDKQEAAEQALRQKGSMVALVEVLAVEVPNRPGSLQAVAALLGSNGVNLDNCSGFVANDRAILVIESHQLPQARALLEAKAFRILSQEEMLRL